jgi:hypothetical protein
MSEQDLDEAAVRAKVAALAISDDATRRRVICGLVGHSRVVDDEGENLTWRVTCARCGELLGESRFQTGSFDAHGAVFRRHVEARDCATCVENLKTLTWQDFWEVQLGQTDGRVQ